MNFNTKVSLSRPAPRRSSFFGIVAATMGAFYFTVALGQNATAQLTINGAGASFPNPLYTKWFSEYIKVDNTVRFNYQDIGSGGGQNQILAGTVDFGASDSPMTDQRLATAPGKILHIPTVAGADVVAYNLPGNPALRLDGATIADIFLGKITQWKDARIASQNPGIQLPALDIVVVHRSDGSGTTFIFTDFLSSVSQEWQTKVGRNASVKWPVGLGAKGNEGVTGQVKNLPGSVAYVELVYAVQQKLPFASVKNSSENYVVPSIASVTAALAAAKIPDDFRFSMVNPPGAAAYPISGATWLLVYQQQRNADVGRKLVEFLKWAETKGQTLAEALDYAPLPGELSKRVLQEIDTIKF
jgi:phosphate transport system substrate-binding protein